MARPNQLKQGAKAACMDDGVRVFEQAPSAPLRPFVRRFLIVEFPAFHRDAHLPNTSPVAALSFAGACRIDGAVPAPVAAYTNVRDTAMAHEHESGHSILITHFTPAGASALLRAPLDQLTGNGIDLVSVLDRPSDVAALPEKLAEAPNHARRIGLVEDFLKSRMHAVDPLVAAACAQLEAGPRRIDEIAQRIGLSQSALERRFRRVVGLTPKRFARVARLQRAMRVLTSGATFAEAALSAGYVDQSHFINDFRRAVGRSPAAFLRRPAI